MCKLSYELISGGGIIKDFYFTVFCQSLNTNPRPMSSVLKDKLDLKLEMSRRAMSAGGALERNHTVGGALERNHAAKDQVQIPQNPQQQQIMHPSGDEEVKKKMDPLLLLLGLLI